MSATRYQLDDIPHENVPYEERLASKGLLWRLNQQGLLELRDTPGERVRQGEAYDHLNARKAEGSTATS